MKQSLSSMEAAEKLANVALGVSAGWLPVETRNGQVDLNPSPSVDVEWEGGENDTIGRLKVEISWKPGLRITGASGRNGEGK
jgi:amphi-Trp domain-containing protein